MRIDNQKQLEQVLRERDDNKNRVFWRLPCLFKEKMIK